MIFSDQDIEKSLKKKKIIVNPAPDLNNQLGPASLDFKLGKEFRVFDSNKKPYINPLDKETFDNLTNLVRIEEKEHFIIHPGEFVLGITMEELTLPDDIGARIEGRSSWGRLGLIIHSTAGYIDPGFKGRLTLEISNIGSLPILLYPGMKICQLAFEGLSSPAKIPYNKRKSSKYYGNQLPTSSKIYKDNL
jgi:dCTP deaminase